jgi:hypothetical protein
MRFIPRAVIVSALAALFTITALVAPAALPTTIEVGAQQPAPSLVGEDLTTIELAPDVVGEVNLTQVECNSDASGTVAFEATGVALGPYPGTYSESGTATIAAPTPPLPTGTLTALETTFTITAADGTIIEGTKQLDPQFSNESFGLCASAGLPSNPAQRLVNFGGVVTYEATITTSEGDTFTDSGTADVIVLMNFDTQNGDETDGSFSEFFTTSNGVIGDLPLRPGKGCGDRNNEHERRDECKKDRQERQQRERQHQREQRRR